MLYDPSWCEGIGPLKFPHPEGLVRTSRDRILAVKRYGNRDDNLVYDPPKCEGIGQSQVPTP